jgi:hypothetical protein
VVDHEDQTEQRDLMNQPDAKYQGMRDIWNDYNHRQEFEHELIDRKTTWLLTTQAILFAASSHWESTSRSPATHVLPQ